MSIPNINVKGHTTAYMLKLDHDSLFVGRLDGGDVTELFACRNDEVSNA